LGAGAGAGADLAQPLKIKAPAIIINNGIKNNFFIFTPPYCEMVVVYGTIINHFIYHPFWDYPRLLFSLPSDLPELPL
jgi:hypothetical protein